MSSPPGDRASVSVSVAVEPAVAFEVFTAEIELWWKHGPKFRVGRRSPGVLTFEPGVGGRLLETFDGPAGPRALEMGRITVWEPPSRLQFEWRGVNFKGDEKTDVEVRFEPTASGTLVTVVHRGWNTLRPDHPARHGAEVPAFIRMIGLWWGELMTSLREHAARR